MQRALADAAGIPETLDEGEATVRLLAIRERLKRDLLGVEAALRRARTVQRRGMVLSLVLAACVILWGAWRALTLGSAPGSGEPLRDLFVFLALFLLSLLPALQGWLRARALWLDLRKRPLPDTAPALLHYDVTVIRRLIERGSEGGGAEG